jgi:hypothetical protein
MSLMQFLKIKTTTHGCANMVQTYGLLTPIITYAKLKT